MRKNNGILMNVGILAAAGMISRFIGFLYMIPLTYIIGDEGNGYYAAAFAVYIVFLLISSYTIPSAISKIIAERLDVGEFKNAHRIFKCAIIYVTVVGMVGGLVLFIGADYFAPGRSAEVLRFFAPTIFIFGFLGVFRGYFQGHHNMKPTSASQIIEQIFNAVVSVGGAYILTQIAAGTDTSTKAVYGAKGSALGTGTGVFVALLFMLYLYYTDRNKRTKRLESDCHEDISYKEIYKKIILIVTPFILSTAIYNLSTFINSTLFSRILMYVKHVNESNVASMYGIFSRKAMVITNLPIAFSSAAASVMIPEIAGSYAKGDEKAVQETISKVTKVILLIAIPSAAGLFFLSRPVLMILFPQRESIAEASMLLGFLAVTVVFYSLSTVSNAVLQGLGRVKVPVVNGFVSLVLQTVTLSALLVFTDLRDISLCIVTILFSLSMCILNAISLRDVTLGNDIKKIWGLPIISSIVMGGFAIGTYRLVTFLIFKAGKAWDTGIIPAEMLFEDYIYSDYLVNLVATVTAILVSVIVYFGVLFRSGAVSEEDIKDFLKEISLIKYSKKCMLLNDENGCTVKNI